MVNRICPDCGDIMFMSGGTVGAKIPSTNMTCGKCGCEIEDTACEIIELQQLTNGST